MKKCLQVFNSSIHDIRSLLELTNSDAGREHRIVILKSAIVLMIASWEIYVEQLGERSIEVLTSHLRDSNPVPIGVKQNISLFHIIENRSKVQKFSESVWEFSDKGWKKAYQEFCKFSTMKLNTASPKNIIELYKNILGIRDITSTWVFQAQTADDCQRRLDDLVLLRHDIAHGANKRTHELNEVDILSHADFIDKMAEKTYDTVFDKTSTLSILQGIRYSLASSCFLRIIEFASGKADTTLTLQEIKALGTSAQGNHNKLCYEPWGLLSVINRNSRQITERLLQFQRGELNLPLEILVFDNGDAIPLPNTPQISFADIC